MKTADTPTFWMAVICKRLTIIRGSTRSAASIRILHDAPHTKYSIELMHFAGIVKIQKASTGSQEKIATRSYRKVSVMLA
jgi:hypothetical protein